MFKVMCINENWTFSESVKGRPYPLCGNDYTVIEERQWMGRQYYALAEFENDSFFYSKHFAILPDQLEEAIEEKELATA